MATALLPRLDSFKNYGAKRAMADGIAGTILAILLVPQAMAYAQLAGLPPEAGLYAALVPPLLYLFFGTSPFVSVGPVALISLVIAEAAGGADTEPIVAAAIVGIEAGIILSLLGGLQLGRLVNFISEPVLLGFTAAVAILICASQFPTLIGVDPERAGNLPDALAALWSVLPDWRPATAAIGIAALVLLLLLNRYAAPFAWKLGIRPPWRQALAKSLPLLVIIGCAIAATFVEAEVPRVSEPPSGLPSFTLPPLEPGLWFALLPSAIAVAVVIFATATAVAKSLAGSDRSALDTSREAMALGLGNIGASLTGGYAVSASLSRSALVEDSGGRTPVAHVVGAALVLMVLVFFAPVLAYLPRTALAALVISAIFGLVKVREMKGVWRHDKSEAALIAVAFAATLIFGVELGLAIGALAGLAHYLWFSSLPRVTRIGSDDGGQSFRSVDRKHVELDTLPVLGVRIDRSVFFGNAAFVEDEIFELIGRHDDVNCLVIDMRAVNTVDASGASMMQRLIERLYADGIAVHFAETHEPVRHELGLLDSRKCAFHRTLQDAMEDCGSPVLDRIAPS
ncbi:SulP family inorganic anion transporter [Erythrobacter sp.]|uniref:SulP family inorganic anion transporter n=1 Tax=Erythrobacter sp. TaxID=1042 RepID=UPI003C74BF2C